MDPTATLRATIERVARREGAHPLAVLAMAAEIAERDLREAEAVDDTHAVYQYAQLRRWVDAEIDACLSHQAYAEFN
jgi:hypothetical protein